MLALERVAARYGRIAALEDVTLAVSAGELVCLIGANGAGKTTTHKTISGLLRPIAGRILLDGAEIHGLSPREILRRGIAHCPEGRRVFPYMTVAENLEMGCYLRSDARGIAADLEAIYRRFPILGQRRHQAAGTLSGGEQQMLAISRALMSAPKLVLFDEPSLGLAPTLVERMFGIIKDIRAHGVTVVLVEQNAFAALALSDRSYVLEQGRVALSGTGAELLDNPHVRRAYLGA